jgi:hypothetical protein
MVVVPQSPNPSLVFDVIRVAGIYHSSLSFDNKFATEEKYQAIAVTRLVVPNRQAPRQWY